MKERQRIGDYLIRQLTDLRVRHIFGASGTCPPDFSDLLKRAETIEMIEVGDENGAGFAADAYARVAGLGVVYVASGSGVLMVADSMAQAFAAQSPVVLIIIAAASTERQGRPQARLHADSALQKQILAHCTVAATVIDSPATAQAEIDRVLATALRATGPVAIEVPCDLLLARCASGRNRLAKKEGSDPAILQEAVDEAVSLINTAQRPVILAGVEIARFGLEDELRQLARQMGIPVAVTLLARSVVADTEKFFIGSPTERSNLEIGRAHV
jgi:indolepyruvate decarboxylase